MSSNKTPGKWRMRSGSKPPKPSYDSPDLEQASSADGLNEARISSSSPTESARKTNGAGGVKWDMSSLPASSKKGGGQEGEERRKKQHHHSASNSSGGGSSTPSGAFSRTNPSSSSQPSSSGRQQRPSSGNAKMSKSSYVKATNIATSAGTGRLQRILNQPTDQKISYVPGDSDSDDEIATANKAASSGNPGEDFLGNRHKSKNDPVLYTPRAKVGKIEKVQDPLNEHEVASYVGRIVVPQLRIDPRSIGGPLAAKNQKKIRQETLVVSRCKTFEATGLDAISSTALEHPSLYAKHKRGLGLGTKARNKYRYVMLVRSTNRSLLKNDSDSGSSPGTHHHNHKSSVEGDDPDYDDLYAPGTDDVDDGVVGGSSVANNLKKKNSKNDMEDSGEDEVSSFPVLVCMALHSDGTNPDVRKMIELDQLTTIQNESATVIQLAFRDGDTVRIDFELHQQPDDATSAAMRKERFLWSLLQIHAMLCTSVVERNSLEARQAPQARSTATSSSSRHGLLPPLNVRNLDRAELQYVATVNGFLKESPMLCALLDRQHNIGMKGAVQEVEGLQEEKEVPLEDMDGMAYDMMMGNYSTRVALFVSAEERADAEEVLNATQLDNFISEENAERAAAETISMELHRRMRELEAETCRRLIAWEDEKHYSVAGKQGLFTSSQRDTVDALSLASLYTMLDSLDQELGSMEAWLQEREAEIKPIIEDCKDIEEENRQLEQNWKSSDMLCKELGNLLNGLDMPDNVERVLDNPATALVYEAGGAIDIEASEHGVDKIHKAGKSLKEALGRAKDAGGVHLRAVNERAQGLDSTADRFCTSLAHIIATVMEQIAAEVVAGSDHGKVSKTDTHVTISKKIRETQRKFQSALLRYMKLIEVLQQLKPKLLPALRDAYAEMVAEGILMKKRMKGYFQALPGKNSAYLTLMPMDLKDYPAFGEGLAMKTVNAPDIEATLSELLPVVAREAYFTAAFFGLSSKQIDGREKKRNFESAKKSVDHSSQYFRYYIQRTVGIVSEADAERGVSSGDPMLSLVASIYLNEAMENYVDREKKGGDHSLSLAYVRATILELRKKVDKQWVQWVEEQIEWIKSHPGVPLNGKRAGVFASFSRFPAYLDHLLLCVREGRKENYTPDLANIKVVGYYLQKIAAALLESLRECADRETTDKQYAENVMIMENTYFFTQSIKQRGPELVTLFQKQASRASTICKQSTDAYLGWMIKREFKALHSLFSNISRIRRDVGDRDVPIHVPRATFVKTLSKESNREAMKEKIQIIYARMEKHLSEDGGLLPVAWKALVKVLYEWFGRWEKLSSQCYKHVLDPSAVDVVRIAKAAGGGTKESRKQLFTETPAKPPVRRP